ncbi:hypothetical protein CC78DRAFT_580658 [Lojkania enalia]|uniref:Uncharacterized protein n=1 Tax=Lojkania enalia TaxID=147567 RepID=A0A9P4KAB4_9PLEO|nr:hypothetical protein CC78DRAFT_580658 [Didymosphaeria enalia]
MRRSDLLHAQRGPAPQVSHLTPPVPCTTQKLPHKHIASPEAVTSRESLLLSALCCTNIGTFSSPQAAQCSTRLDLKLSHLLQQPSGSIDFQNKLPNTVGSVSQKFHSILLKAIHPFTPGHRSLSPPLRVHVCFPWPRAKTSLQRHHHFSPPTALHCNSSLLHTSHSPSVPSRLPNFTPTVRLPLPPVYINLVAVCKSLRSLTLGWLPALSSDRRLHSPNP